MFLDDFKRIVGEYSNGFNKEELEEIKKLPLDKDESKADLLSKIRVFCDFKEETLQEYEQSPGFAKYIEHINAKKQAVFTHIIQAAILTKELAEIKKDIKDINNKTDIKSECTLYKKKYEESIKQQQIDELIFASCKYAGDSIKLSEDHDDNRKVDVQYVFTLSELLKQDDSVEYTSPKGRSYHFPTIDDSIILDLKANTCIKEDYIVQSRDIQAKNEYIRFLEKNNISCDKQRIYNSDKKYIQNIFYFYVIVNNIDESAYQENKAEYQTILGEVCDLDTIKQNSDVAQYCSDLKNLSLNDSAELNDVIVSTANKNIARFIKDQQNKLCNFFVDSFAPGQPVGFLNGLITTNKDIQSFYDFCKQKGEDLNNYKDARLNTQECWDVFVEDMVELYWLKEKEKETQDITTNLQYQAALIAIQDKIAARKKIADGWKAERFDSEQIDDEETLREIEGWLKRVDVELLANQENNVEVVTENFKKIIENLKKISSENGGNNYSNAIKKQANKLLEKIHSKLSLGAQLQVMSEFGAMNDEAIINVFKEYLESQQDESSHQACDKTIRQMVNNQLLLQARKSVERRFKDISLDKPGNKELFDALVKYKHKIAVYKSIVSKLKFFIDNRAAGSVAQETEGNSEEKLQNYSRELAELKQKYKNHFKNINGLTKSCSASVLDDERKATMLVLHKALEESYDSDGETMFADYYKVSSEIINVSKANIEVISKAKKVLGLGAYPYKEIIDRFKGYVRAENVAAKYDEHNLSLELTANEFETIDGFSKKLGIDYNLEYCNNMQKKNEDMFARFRKKFDNTYSGLFLRSYDFTLKNRNNIIMFFIALNVLACGLAIAFSGGILAPIAVIAGGFLASSLIGGMAWLGALFLTRDKFIENKFKSINSSASRYINNINFRDKQINNELMEQPHPKMTNQLQNSLKLLSKHFTSQAEIVKRRVERVNGRNDISNKEKHRYLLREYACVEGMRNSIDSINGVLAKIKQQDKKNQNQNESADLMNELTQIIDDYIKESYDSYYKPNMVDDLKLANKNQKVKLSELIRQELNTSGTQAQQSANIISNDNTHDMQDRVGDLLIIKELLKLD